MSMHFDKVKDLVTDLGWEISHLSVEGKKTLRELYKIFEIGDFDYTKNADRIMRRKHNELNRVR